MSAQRYYWFPPVPHPEASPPDLTSLLQTLLLEQRSETSELRERLDEALDGREAAESLLEKVRAWATNWGLDDELALTLAGWRSHCRRQPRTPPSWDDDRIDLLEEDVRRLRRELKAAREAEYVAIEKMKQEHDRTTKALDAEHRAFRIAEHERDRAVAAEQKIDELRDEIGRLRAALDF